MLKLFLLLFAGLSALSLYGQADPLQKLLKAEGVRNAAVGISVKSFPEGEVVAGHLPDMALHPASVTKLLTTALALKQKGEGYRYRTSVFLTGKIENGVLKGNILVRASGDPCLDSRYFKDYKWIARLQEKIRDAGIRKIEGDILLEGGPEEVCIPGSWPWEDISNYYGAPWHPFNYRDNTYVLKFRTDESGSRAKLLSVFPGQPDVRFRNEVRASENNKDDAWIYGGPYSNVLYIQGTVPAGREAFVVKGAIHRPFVCFRQELKELLQKDGISVEGKQLPARVSKEWFYVDSPALQEIVRETNKKSVNLFAEALGKLSTSGCFQEFCRDELDRMGIPSSGVILKDACGLSPLNAVPAAVFTDLLVAAGRMEWKESFVSSLPVAGKDAGLNGYCAAYPELKGRLRAKTGSFAGVRCLSGYLQTRKGKQLAFTVLINNYTGTAIDLQKQVGAYLQSLL